MPFLLRRVKFLFLFLAILPPLMGSDSLEEDSREIFRRFDENHSGVLESNEVANWPWAVFDRDKDGLVAEMEFRMGYIQAQHAAFASKDRQAAFLVLDWNKDGMISGIEFSKPLLPADQNKDGVVVLDEFLVASVPARPKIAPAPANPGLDALNNF